MRVEAKMIANRPDHSTLEEVVARLSLESGISAVSWEAEINQE